MSKLFSLALFIAFAFQVNAQDCSNMGRAIVTDQKNMSFDMTFKYFQADYRKLISLGTSDYVSWKGEQVGCLANVGHFAVFKLVTKGEAGQRCESTVDVYALDHFVHTTTFEREYKPRNLEENCRPETPEEAAITAKCEALPQCPRVDNNIQIRDYNDDCACKFVPDMISFDDQVGAYEDFFNPKKEFPRPDSIDDLFGE